MFVSAKGHRDQWLLPGVTEWFGKFSVSPEQVSMWVPGKVINTSQFSVGTVFIHALWDTRYRPTCRSRFPGYIWGQSSAG